MAEGKAVENLEEERLDDTAGELARLGFHVFFEVAVDELEDEVEPAFALDAVEEPAGGEGGREGGGRVNWMKSRKRVRKGRMDSPSSPFLRICPSMHSPTLDSLHRHAFHPSLPPSLP